MPLALMESAHPLSKTWSVPLLFIILLLLCPLLLLIKWVSRCLENSMSGQMENMIFILLWILELGVLVYIIIWPVLGGRGVLNAGLWAFGTFLIWFAQLAYLAYRTFSCAAIGCGEVRSTVEIIALVAINISLLVFLRRLSVKR